MRIPGVKRLYTFMLQTFLPLFTMTFFVCLFIVIMEFLWSHIEDLVGKGLGIDVLAELFFYAAMVMVPLALPLAIMLASLMTFGNLGEHLELTAMKSSGISLIKVMAPLIVLISAIAVGAFFFQNDVLPKAQVKMWTLLFSMRQKSPTLDIPEGAVYSQIPGYNLYVRDKGDDNAMLYDVLIYGNQNMGYPRVVAADSGRLSFTQDKKHLVLSLYSGNWYEELAGNTATASAGKEMYRREAFRDKTILIPYDATFSRMDDETMRQQYVGKNITELRHTIDSVQQRVDSVGTAVAREMKLEPVVGVSAVRIVPRGNTTVTVPEREVKLARPVNLDSLIEALPPAARSSLLANARTQLGMKAQNYMLRSYISDEDKFVIRRHEIELQKKFTLSLACLIFFFIGAPLGAIIRKGGLGTPIVISVILFIIYYIIDNSGYKLARDAHWPVWQGIWLSSAVLLPLGIFLTKKAVNDSAVLNIDAYRNAVNRLLGLHQTRKLELKEVVIEEVDTARAVEMLHTLAAATTALLQRHPRPQGYLDYWQQGIDRQALQEVDGLLGAAVDHLSNSRDQQVLNKAMDFPVLRQLLTYQPAMGHKTAGTVLAALFPVGLPVYLVGARHQKNLLRDLRQVVAVCGQLEPLLLNQNPSQETT